MKYILTFCAFFSINILIAQNEMPAVEMADTLRSNGKIYVVVVIAAIVFAGILFYMIAIDRKISKLEKETEK